MTGDSRMYYTRRDWLLAEIIIGVVSIATGISGMAAGGILSNTLSWTGDSTAWYVVFVGSGFVMLAAALSEMVFRAQGIQRCGLCRFARVRMWSHFFNALSWMYAFATLLAARAFMVSIFYEALPLIILNAWGALEHAKALYLDMARARTTSLVRATVERIRS